MLVVGMHTSVTVGGLALLIYYYYYSKYRVRRWLTFGVHDLSFLYFLHITHYVHLCTLRPYTMSQTAAMRW